MPLNDEEVFGGAVASPTRVTPEEQARRDRLAADLKADELNNPDNPLHPTDPATRAALTRDLARTEAKAAPKAAPTRGLSDEEVFGLAPEEEAKGFVENFKKYSKGTSIAGAWNLFAGESMWANLYRYMRERPELEKKLQYERAAETRARQIIKNPDQYSREVLSQAIDTVREADAKKARGSWAATVPGAVEAVKGMADDIWNNPGKFTAEFIDSYIS